MLEFVFKNVFKRVMYDWKDKIIREKINKKLNCSYKKETLSGWNGHVEN